MFDDVMTLNEADNPTKDCHPEVRHIYPVRYALSESFLSDAYNGKRNSVATPISINTSVSSGSLVSRNPTMDHQLRRLREGYVYVFYNIGASQPIWRQFQSVWPNDKSEDNQYSLITKYGFREYDWAKLDAKTVKKKQDQGHTLKDHDPDTYKKGAVQDFIDIPKKDVTKIWIGYAPAPWPKKLLKAIQDDWNGIRSRFMSEINVENESGPNIMPFESDESWEKIADFIDPDAGSPFSTNLNSLIFNRLDPLPIDYENSEVMRKRLCERDQKRARIVALRDDVGEAEQIAHLHAIFQESYLSAVNDNKYATQIGSLVRAVLKNGLVERKYFRDDFESRLKGIEESIEKKAAKCRGPVEIQNHILERTGDLSNAAQIDSALNVYNLDPSSSKAQDVYEYACYLTGLATLGMSTSQKGIEVLQSAIKNSAFASGGKKMAASDFRTIFNSIIGAAADTTNAINSGRLKCFEITVTQHTATFITLTNTGEHITRRNPATQKVVWAEEIARVFNGGELSHSTVKSPDELVEKLRKLQRESAGVIAPYKESGKTVPYDTEMHFYHANKLEEIKPSERFRKYYRRLEKVTGIAAGASVFCGVLTLNKLLRQDAPWSEDDYWNITLTLSCLVQDLADIWRFRCMGVDISTSRAVSLLTRTGGIGVASELTAAKTAVSAVRCISVGAGLIAAGVSVHFALKGLKENDGAAFAGNMLMAAGSVLMLLGTGFPPLMIAGIICVAIGFIVTFFQLSRIEKWAAGCFWGNGASYIYWNYWQRGPAMSTLEHVAMWSTLPTTGIMGPATLYGTRELYLTASDAPERFDEQLKLSYALGHGDKTMKENFKRELTDFKELTAGMIFRNTIEGDLYVDLLCDAIQTEEDCKKVEISFFVVRTSETTYIMTSGNGTTNYYDGTNDEHFIPLEVGERKLAAPGHMEFSILYGKYDNDPILKEKFGTLKKEMVDGIPSYFHMRAKFTAPSTGRTITASTRDDPICAENPERLGWYFGK